VPGLTLAPATGLISGRPAAAGTSGFIVQVSDSESSAATATATESITVNVSALAVTTTTLPQATVGVPYSARLVGSGGIQPYTWSLFGTLPA